MWSLCNCDEMALSLKRNKSYHLHRISVCENTSLSDRDHFPKVDYSAQATYGNFKSVLFFNAERKMDEIWEDEVKEDKAFFPSRFAWSLATCFLGRCQNFS